MLVAINTLNVIGALRSVFCHSYNDKKWGFVLDRRAYRTELEELKRNLETYKLHNICKSCSRSRAVVTANVTKSRCLRLYYASTESKRNKSSNSSIQFNSYSAWCTFSLVYFNLPERVKTTRSNRLKFRLPFDSGRSWYLIKPVRVMNCYRKNNNSQTIYLCIGPWNKKPCQE